MITQKPQRKYLKIWEQLKLSRDITVRVHTNMTKTLIKAIYEEKRNDLGFKIDLDLVSSPELVIKTKVIGGTDKDAHLDYINIKLVSKVIYKNVTMELLK